ncbi:MAG: DUF5615 family PIN-like protein [Candidatus Promineofilum sp.]|nr:DUF5615 family PIN-like protein [Promineifilum sp.]MCW5863746.1 DUF5615 family PIN-like protein [Anaerolineae bacterium]
MIVVDSIRLYLDEDTISRALIAALSARNVDILSAHVAGLISAPDDEHLRFATSTGRTLFTFNTRDFARLHAEWLSTDRHHAGIIVSDQIQVGQLIRRLLRLLDGLSAADMGDRLEFLGKWK